MKKSRTILLLLLLVVVGVGGFFAYEFTLGKDVEIKGDPDLYKKVTLEIAKGEFYNVRVPADDDLISSNYHNSYEFEDIKIYVVDSEPAIGYYTKVDDSYVVAESRERMYAPTFSGWELEKPFSVAAPLIDESIILDSIPPYTPTTMSEELAIETSNATLYYPTAGGYLETTLYFDKFDSVVSRLLARFPAIYNQDIVSYYNDGSMMYAESSDFCVGVKKRDFNTAYAVTGQFQRDAVLTMLGSDELG